MIDRTDGLILHAVQLSPRSSFRRIADVIGVPEQTVARRYRAMRRDGLFRVTGVVNPLIYGQDRWIVRLQAKPDDLPRLAEALVRRPEVTHANVLSGWTELVCTVRAPIGGGSDGLLQRLPRTSAVLGMDVDLVLHEFGGPAGIAWTGYGYTLTSAQAAALQTADAEVPQRVAAPTDDDQPLLAALAEDGRIPLAQLADETGWSPARVKRRVGALHAAGTLTYDVDVLPERLGFRLAAMVWMTLPPDQLTSAAEKIATHDEVASVIAVSGRHNVVAVVICRDVDHLYRYIAEQLATVGGIQSYDVSVRTQRLKQAASLIAHGRLVHAEGH